MEQNNPNLENQENATEIQEQTPEKKGLFGKKKPKQKKGWKQELKEWVVSLVSAVLIVLVCQNFFFTLIRVDGESMCETLQNGERLFVTVTDVKFGKEIERGTVVICHYPNRGRTNFVKRVVACPGDSVYRQDGITHVVYTDENGNTVDEPLEHMTSTAQQTYVRYYSGNNYEPYTLGEDEYFVVGDNRGNSHDSRDWNDTDPSRDVGPITKNMIVGRVRCVFWPLNAIRSVD
ncbi:MAG: signal peptidase I [Clostridia bacterium]|nr:signal peptidase I [Clostridia bacterium]